MTIPKQNIKAEKAITALQEMSEEASVIQLAGAFVIGDPCIRAE